MALRWRVTIADYATGVRYVYDRDEPKRSEAIVAAIEDFRVGHPEATVYGETHGVERVTEPAKDG